MAVPVSLNYQHIPSGDLSEVLAGRSFHPNDKREPKSSLPVREMKATAEAKEKGDA